MTAELPVGQRQSLYPGGTQTVARTVVLHIREQAALVGFQTATVAGFAAVHDPQQNDQTGYCGNDHHTAQ